MYVCVRVRGSTEIECDSDAEKEIYSLVDFELIEGKAIHGFNLHFNSA